MTRTRYRIFDDAYPHFLTCTVVAWLPVFSRPELVRSALNSWQYLQKHGIEIYGYVVLENHLHWIAAGADLARQVGRFKSFVARTIIDDLRARGQRGLLDALHYYKLQHKTDQTYQLWQESSHPQQLENEPMLLQKLEYMHLNPVRRGYVDDPTHWRYSSARNYAGQPGLIEVVTDWRF